MKVRLLYFGDDATGNPAGCLWPRTVSMSRYPSKEECRLALPSAASWPAASALAESETSLTEYATTI